MSFSRAWTATPAASRPRTPGPPHRHDLCGRARAHHRRGEHLPRYGRKAHPCPISRRRTMSSRRSWSSSSHTGSKRALCSSVCSVPSCPRRTSRCSRGSASLTKDIYQRYFHPEASGKNPDARRPCRVAARGVCSARSSGGSRRGYHEHPAHHVYASTRRGCSCRRSARSSGRSRALRARSRPCSRRRSSPSSGSSAARSARCRCSRSMRSGRASAFSAVLYVVVCLTHRQTPRGQGASRAVLRRALSSLTPIPR